MVDYSLRDLSARAICAAVPGDFRLPRIQYVKGSNYVSEIKDESYLVAVDSGHLPQFSGRAQCLPCGMIREGEGGVD